MATAKYYKPVYSKKYMCINYDFDSLLGLL